MWEHLDFRVLRIRDRAYEGHTLESSVGKESEVTQSCPTLCDPMDSSSPGSAIPGILQAKTLEWVAISFSNA